MLTRFLRYSLERGRKIRVLVMQEGAIRPRNILVLAYDEKTVVCLVAGRKTPLTLSAEDILSASYARGDSGE